jgi:hypothetical protein
VRLRKQDPNGDYQFGHNAADFWFNQIEGVGQSILTRLLLFRGEWFLDLQEGTPWGGFPLSDAVVAQGQILGTHTQLSRDMAIHQRVLDTQGVLAITAYDSQFEPNSRQFSVQATVETIYGLVAIQVLPSPFRPYFVLNYSALGGADPL